MSQDAAPVAAERVARLLDRHGVDVYAGVPCSLVEDLIAVLERRSAPPYVRAVREDAAIGVAGGAWLGGRRPLVLMQNSGLGTGANALASFSLMYGLPLLLLVTWRGFQGRDAPEHLLMGEITPSLLDLLGVPHRVLSVASLDADVAWACREMDRRLAPVALLVPPGVVEMGRVDRASGATGTSFRPPTARAGLGALAPPDLRPVLSRKRALEAVIKQLGDEPVIHANGYICRESCSIADRPQNFYMLGSMGLASSIGLGLALARPGRPVVVLDGDGNLLMSLGSAAMVGSLRPPHLVHVVLDNEAYGSTGNQASPSREVRLDRVADAVGYRTVVAVTAEDEVGAAVRAALEAEGPHFVLVKVTAEEADVPRITHDPRTIRDRFRASVLQP